MKATPHRTVPFAALSILLLGLVLVLATRASEPADAAESYPGQGFLPDNRAWEMVSPPDKNGGEVIVYNGSTKAAVDCADECALLFGSKTGFGDVQGFNGVLTDYIARRTGGSGTQGWDTHGVTPPQGAPSQFEAAGGERFGFLGDHSPDLSRGVYRAYSPVPTATDPHPNVDLAPNLYLRDDLTTPGLGSYQLLSDSPVDLGHPQARSWPWIGGTDSNVEVVAWESPLRYADADSGTVQSLYVSKDGSTRVVDQVPAPTDPVCGGSSPACSPVATSSVSGVRSGAHNENKASTAPRYVQQQRLVSDDGTKVFYRAPVGPAGGGSGVNPDSRLYMRDDQGTAATADDTYTRIQQSEKTTPESPLPAAFWYASADGSKGFFTTEEGLVDGDDNGSEDLYLYTDSDDPANDSNLTQISIDAEGADAPDVDKVFQVSPDGDYAYFTASGELVAGQAPLAPGTKGLYAWHQGEGLELIGALPAANGDSAINAPDTVADYDNWMTSRIAADGTLLFMAADSSGLVGHGFNGYDHGECDPEIFQGTSSGCRELFVYSPAEDQLSCASCNPSGAPATQNALVEDTIGTGAAQANEQHLSQALSSDGKYVFFTTADSLLPSDENGPCEKIRSGSTLEVYPCSDAYVYDVESSQLHLLSSGKSTSGSYFLDASDNGSDVFIATREKLSAWDTDNAYDIYDARIDGGFPEPETEQACEGTEECRGPGSGGPGEEQTGSSGLEGDGNVEAAPPPDCSSSERKLKRAKKKLRKTKRRIRKANNKKAKHKARKAKKRAAKKFKRSKRSLRRCERGNS